jgi:hypothetical protein
VKLATPGSRELAIGAAVGVAALAAPLVFPVEHHFAWDEIPGFYAIFGAAGAVALIVAAKWLGKALIVKPEGWWSEDRASDESPDGAGHDGAAP